MENRVRAVLEQLRRRRDAAERVEKAQRRVTAKAVRREHRTFNEGRGTPHGGGPPGR